MATLDIRVSASADDFTRDDASLSLSAVYGWLGYANNGNAQSGNRFLNVTIPNAATITAAYVTLTDQYAYSGVTCKVLIKGEAADNPATFTTDANMLARSRTTASVSWNPVPSQAVNATFNTPSLVSIIQEIVNRAGWASGNAMVIFFPNDASSTNAYRGYFSYNGSATKAALLHIEYTSTQAISTAGAIASAGAFGTLSVNRKIVVSGINTAEAFGTAAVQNPQTISTAGTIDTAEAFGSLSVNQSLNPSGITSAEAFGTTVVLNPQTISTAGAIDTAEAFGTTVVLNPQTVSTAGAIASTEAFGTAVVLNPQTISTAGAIESTEAFGTLSVNQKVVVSGIISENNLGEPFVNQSVNLISIVSAEEFGLSSITVEIEFGTIEPSGISTIESFGTATVEVDSNTTTVLVEEPIISSFVFIFTEE